MNNVKNKLACKLSHLDINQRSIESELPERAAAGLSHKKLHGAS